MIKGLKIIGNKWLEAGIARAPENETRRVRTSNFWSLVVFIFISVIGPLLLSIVGIEEFIPLLMVLAMMISVPIQNNRGATQSARWIIVLSGNLVLALLVGLNIDRTAQVALLICPIVGLIFFELKEKVSIAVGFLLPVALHTFFWHQDHFNPGGYSKDAILELVNAYNTFILSFILTFYFYITNTQNEKKLLAAAEDVKKESLRLKKTQELALLGLWERSLITGKVTISKEVRSIFELPENGEISLVEAQNMIHPEDRDFVSRMSEKMIALKTGQRFDFRILTKKGHLRFVRSVNEIEYNEEGVGLAVLSVFQDITEMKNIENLRLEKDAAEKANQAKSAFLANMSHELRTPMHGILSFARFGQQKFATASKEKLKSYFDEIHESGSNLMSLLNDLLDLSKLEAGKTTYTMQVEDLKHLTENILSEMSAFAKESHLQVHLTCSQETVPTRCDAAKIGSVIRNLLSNAIKFSNKGSRIEVKLATADTTTRFELLNVGVGIPTSELESVFDKFAQSSKTRSGAGGTGLGLTICREIIHQHGGRIWAQCTAENETKFTFELPDGVASAATSERPSAKAG